jgi:hypothetical protein
MYVFSLQRLAVLNDSTYLGAVSVAIALMMNSKQVVGSGRGRLQSNISPLVWRNRGKQSKLVRIVSVLAGFRTEHGYTENCRGKSLSRDSWCRSRDSNWVPPDV